MQKLNKNIKITLIITALGALLTISLYSLQAITFEDFKEDLKNQTETISQEIEKLGERINENEDKVELENKTSPNVFFTGGKILLKRVSPFGEDFFEEDNLEIFVPQKHHLEFKVNDAILLDWSKCYFESKPEILGIRSNSDNILEVNEEDTKLSFFIILNYEPKKSFLLKNVASMMDHQFLHDVGSLYYKISYTDLLTGITYHSDTNDFGRQSVLKAYVSPDAVKNFTNCDFN